MVLSIGMIVKNEEKYLEKCLTALKPILDNVDSELIIADTGSTDNTVEIAKKFTDNVFYFEWIKDFAAARNSTLERAKGEWYMYLDADEIFQNCDNLIRFFNSGDYKKYKSAVYTIRSYADLSKPDQFHDTKPARLFAIEEDTRFKNAVHEAITAKPPSKVLNVIADHFGYAYFDNTNSTGLAKAKSERNLELLMSELAKQEDAGKIEPFTYKYIADCYGMVADRVSQLENLQKGLALLDPSDIKTITYYQDIITIYMVQQRDDEVIELCEKYFSKENKARKRILTSDCYIHYAMAISSLHRGNLDVAIPNFGSALELYEKYVNNKLLTNELIFVPFKVTVPMMKASCAYIYISCRDTGKLDLAAKALRNFPYTEQILSDKKYMQENLLMRVLTMEKTDFSPLAELYGKLDDFNKEQLVNIMLWHVFKSENLDSFVSNFKRIAKGDKRLEDTVKLYSHHFLNNDLTFDAVKKFISAYGVKENDHILCLMMKAGFDITLFITAEDFDAKERVRAIYRKSQTTKEMFESYDVSAISPEGLEKAAEFYVMTLLSAEQHRENSNALFEKFGELGEKCLENEPEYSPDLMYIYAAMIVGRASIARKNEKYKTCAEELGKLGDFVPSLKGIITQYWEEVKAGADPAPSVKGTLSSKPAPKSSAAPKSEFQMLAEQFKQNIYGLIDAGNTEDAKALIAEYELLCPNDPEISALKNKL